MTRLSGNNTNRTPLLIGTIVAALLIGLALWAVSQNKGTVAAKDAVNFNLADAPYEGKADAPVTVVAIEDFKCPICKNFQETVAPELKTKYVDTGKVKWHTLVWPFLAKAQNLPTDDSKLAAEAALCVFDQKGNEGFTTFKDILFRAQGDERTVWADKPKLKEWAANVEGLDTAKFATCLDSDAPSDRVDANTKQVEGAGVTGTPTIFVNGKQVASADVAGVSAAIDAASK